MLNRMHYWLIKIPSVSGVMTQLRCLTVTQEGDLVKLRGGCVFLRRQTLTQAESEQMQLIFSLVCFWCADSSSHPLNVSLVAGILLRLWSLYVFAHVIMTTPVTGMQVHVIAPVCVLDDFCSNLKRLLLQCSSKT